MPEEGRRILIRLLANRFPTLKPPPELGSISNPRQIEAMIDRVLEAITVSEARAALSGKKPAR